MLSHRILETIKNIPDENILAADLNELSEYYTEEFEIHPLALHLERIYETLTEIEVLRNNYSYNVTEGYRISYHIPFSGDTRLLYSNLSYSSNNLFEVDDIIKTDDPAIKIIVFSLEYPKNELEKIVTPDFKANEFIRAFKRYMRIIEEINKRVLAFNAQLPDLVNDALAKRKRKADDYVALSKTLAIPLIKNPNAPNTIPIPLNRVQTKTPRLPGMPGAGKFTNEYSISNADYENIRRIIGFAGFSMEKAAGTFKKLDEYGLRNILVAFLNTHYLGTATGETFCRVGRADIHILFENKAAYIAECKVWVSDRDLTSAVEQLFKYTTWRDIKTSIIIFNKNSMFFSRILLSIDDYLRKNDLCRNIRPVSENEWLCEFRQSPDAAEYITIHIIAFDLYLDPARKNTPDA